MRPVMFRCPGTGFRVQATVPDHLVGPMTTHVALDCPVCSRPHLMNLAECAFPGDDNEND